MYKMLIFSQVFICLFFLNIAINIVSWTSYHNNIVSWDFLHRYIPMSYCPYYRAALMLSFLQRVSLTKRVGASIPMLSVRPASAETRRSTCIGPTRTKTGRTISWRPENSLFSLDTSYSSRCEHKMFKIRGGAKRAEARNVFSVPCTVRIITEFSFCTLK